MKFLICLILSAIIFLHAQNVVGTSTAKNTTLQSGFWYTVVKKPSAIADNLPKSYALYQNYPNPFNPTTAIRFDLPRECTVKLTVYDLLGRQLAQIDAGSKPAGTHTLTFDATNYASGLYFYQLQTAEYSKVGRMVVAK